MVNWTPNIDALLFKHILKLHAIKPNYDALEKAMRDDGIDLTAKAITHRIAKLRNAMNEDKVPGAPVLGAAVTKPRKAMGGLEKRKVEALEEEKPRIPKGVVEDGDFFDEEPKEPVAKKAKKANGVTKKPAKTVIQDGDPI